MAMLTPWQPGGTNAHPDFQLAAATALARPKWASRKQFRFRIKDFHDR